MGSGRALVAILFFGWGLARATGAEPTWAEQMQRLKGVLPELLVDVTSDKNFDNPKNADRILNNTKKLSELAHSLARMQESKGEGKPIDGDPTIGLISVLLDDEVQRAYSALKDGHRAYARRVLRSVSTYCVACHTRTDFGPNFPRLELKLETDALTQLELADIYAATRQFDRALAEYEKVASDPNAALTRSIEWEKAMKRALAIAVRVNHDPDRALKLVGKVVDSPHAATYFKAEAVAWQEGLRKWKKEATKKQASAPTALAEARRLIEQGRATQKYPADETGSVYYLRASAVLHEVMRQSLTADQLAQAFYLSGVAYEALQPLGLWTLPELYYESCIRKAPHSAVAESCFQRYEKNVYLGYSGSGGLALPQDVAKRIRDLQDLAKTAPKRS